MAGAAAILGFVYQVLGTSARLCEATLERSRDGDPPSTVTATLEPLAGGDLELEAFRRTCIQFKHRSRLLNTAELLEVLTDLFRAHCSTPCDIYELQCNQPLNSPAARLVERLSGSTVQCPGIEQSLRRLRLRCSEVFSKAGQPPGGFDGYFDDFVSRFRVGAPLDSAALRASLETWLGSRLPYADQAAAKLDQMVGALIRRSTANDTPVTSDDLFELLGLAPTPSGEPEHRLSAALAAALAARHFDVREDVREVRLPSNEHPLTLITGKSGRGKTFSLCRFAFELDARGEAVLLVAAPDLKRLEDNMVRLVALDALDHETPVLPSALARLWRRRTGREQANLWVLWEGCRDVTELAALQVAGGLGSGIRLVAELPPGSTTAQTALKDVPTRQVADFTDAEMAAAEV